MKKLLMAVAAFGMLLTSCAKDDAVAPVEEKEALVSFCVNAPSVTTRYGEGEKATTLYYAVYDANGRVENLQGQKEIKLSTTVDLKLIQGREYDILFWAADAQAPYTVDWDNKTMEVNYQSLAANEEEYDAFFKYEELGVVSGALSKTIELRRPFAQLNIGTADTNDAEAAEFVVTTTGVTVSNVYTEMDFATGFVSEPKEVTFQLAEKADGTIEANGKTYDHIAMNYLLIGQENENSQSKKLVNVTLNINDEVTRSYTSVPVERNYRTNIVGNILTSPAQFNVVILPGFIDDNYEEWDGTTQDEPTLKDGVYYISHAAEFAWVLANKEGAKLSLEADINFGGHQIPDWSKTTGTGYSIVIEGNGNTIYNFKNVAPAARSTSDQIVGLFDIVNGATVNNLTIEGASVDAGSGENAFAGVLFGKTFGEINLTNVTIKDCDVKGTNKLGGLIGFVAELSPRSGKAATATNCKVIDTDVTTYNDLEGEAGLAGGFIGYIAQGNNTFTDCIVEGGSIKVKNSRKSAERANSAFIGAVAGNGTIILNNCSAQPFYFKQLGGVYPYESPYGSYPTSSSSGEPHPLVGGNRGNAKVVINNVEVITKDTFAEACRQEGATINLVAGIYTIPTDIADNVTIKANSSVAFDMGGTSLNVNGLTIDGGKIEGDNTTGQTTLTLNGNNNTIKNVIFNFTGGNGIALDINDSDENSVTIVEGVDFGTDDSFRNIGWCQLKGKLHVKNCQFTNGVYNVHIDSGNNTAELIVEDSKLYGLTTLANTLKKATFINCEMGYINGYNAFWLRSDADFIGCKFAKKDASLSYSANGYGITSASHENNTVTFTGCSYIDGSAINYLDTESTTAPWINMDSDAEIWMWFVDGEFIAGNATVIDSTTTAPIDAINEALADGKNIILTGDVAGEAETTAPYGNKYAIKQDGGIIDGGGNKLDMECYGDDYGIMTSGGTVKNITIEEGCRAIMIMHPTEDVILDNVNIGGNGVLYPINTGEAGSEGVNLIVTNSTLAGWTSYSLIESASFTNVHFEQGTYYNDIYGRVLKPYVNTTLTDCSFIEHMNLDLSGLAEGHKVVFNNCTVNGQAVNASVFTIPSIDAEYDTELFTVDLPSWATDINDCVVFE